MAVLMGWGYSCLRERCLSAWVSSAPAFFSPADFEIWAGGCTSDDSQTRHHSDCGVVRSSLHFNASRFSSEPCSASTTPWPPALVGGSPMSGPGSHRRGWGGRATPRSGKHIGQRRLGHGVGGDVVLALLSGLHLGTVLSRLLPAQRRPDLRQGRRGVGG